MKKTSKTSRISGNQKQSSPGYANDSGGGYGSGGRSGGDGSGGVTSPKGFWAGGTTCGIKASGKSDLAIILAEQPCAAAGMFTKNQCPGAPVIVGKRHIRAGIAQAIVANSGCSNVCTGQRGIDDAIEMCRLTAQVASGRVSSGKVEPGHVLPCSTGVIGRYLPMPKIRAGIENLVPQVGRGQAFDDAAARAIMTTDLVPKSAVRRVRLPGAGGKTVEVTLAGIAKGSGMIQPNMATMFGFITTDAAITPVALKKALREAVNVSFNKLSVDHDTSTSDTVLILASGAAGNQRIASSSDRAWRIFAAALEDLCRDLAYQVVKDGEGAQKVFKVVVRGAKTQKDADKVGYTLVGSPLLKCAVHGGDPNWGRLVAGVGRSGAKVLPERLTIFIGDLCVGKNGFALEHSPSQQKKLNQLMAARDIVFTIDLGIGSAQTQWLGCDLSKEYVTINADYTT